MKNREINPIPLIVIAVVAVVALGYFFLIRPGQREAQVRAEWVTPEAAALRGPGKPRDESHEQFVQKLREKEGSRRPLTRRDRE